MSPPTLIIIAAAAAAFAVVNLVAADGPATVCQRVCNGGGGTRDNVCHGTYDNEVCTIACSGECDCSVWTAYTGVSGSCVCTPNADCTNTDDTDLTVCKKVCGSNADKFCAAVATSSTCKVDCQGACDCSVWTDHTDGGAGGCTCESNACSDDDDALGAAVIVGIVLGAIVCCCVLPFACYRRYQSQPPYTIMNNVVTAAAPAAAPAPPQQINAAYAPPQQYAPQQPPMYAPQPQYALKVQVQA
jgi:hypothetical protein